jgi:hypothetical protein
VLLVLQPLQFIPNKLQRLFMVFTGKLIFQQEYFFQKLLHNETAYAIQRRPQWDEIETVILPIRV